MICAFLVPACRVSSTTTARNTTTMYYCEHNRKPNIVKLMSCMVYGHLKELKYFFLNVDI